MAAREQLSRSRSILIWAMASAGGGVGLAAMVMSLCVLHACICARVLLASRDAVSKLTLEPLAARMLAQPPYPRGGNSELLDLA